MDPIAAMTRIAEEVRARLNAVDSAREEAYRLQREVTRAAASCIRAIHQRQPDEADRWRAEAGRLCAAMTGHARPIASVLSSGFVQDAQKEYAEATLLGCLVNGDPPPPPAELGVEGAAWLNGLAEASTELRRYILDLLKQKDFAAAEAVLGRFDAAYHLLVTFDFPDAVSYGLKRRLDVVRSSLERTTSDVMITVREANLQAAVERLEERLRGG